MGDSARRTISAELARQLEEHGDLSPIINNKRKLSFAAITPPASDGSRSSSSSSSSASLITPASFHTYALSQNRKIVEIPEELESVETYVFLGFDESTAAQLWYRYARARDHPNDPPYGGGLEPDFFEFALRQIESGNIHDATCGDDDWDAFMRGKGINQRMREAILRPGFDGIRCTASCRFWLVGALTRAWAGLTALEQILQKKAVQTQNIRETTRRAAGRSRMTPRVLSLLSLREAV
ncbi:MAG: hypothetical protein M1838_001479 [Thelocarpon superellum]|nr:MAG: hypothetical protein M1838_001479 [Thelocarpon superellum]